MPRYDPKLDTIIPTPHKPLTGKEIEIAKRLATEDVVGAEELPRFMRMWYDYARQRKVPYWRVVGCFMDLKIRKDGTVDRIEAEAAFKKWGLEEVYRWELEAKKR